MKVNESFVKYVGDAEAPDFDNVFVVSSEVCCNSNEISVTNFSESFVKESFFSIKVLLMKVFVVSSE